MGQIAVKEVEKVADGLSYFQQVLELTEEISVPKFWAAVLIHYALCCYDQGVDPLRGFNEATRVAKVMYDDHTTAH